MPAHTPAPSTPSAHDLGIVDALVQSSFLIQELLGDVSAEHDVSIVLARLLGVLVDREPRMAQLAALLGGSKQSVNGLIDRAERRGLVRRISIPVGDDRAVHVSLTEEGSRLAEQIHRQVTTRVAAIARDLSQPDRDRVSGLLSCVVARGAASRGANLDPLHASLPR